ncbi:MAG TPA: isoprenylcysteine carboxylmethyltransferase family protein [Chloroflexota bacterium]|nr:isoprenylcysteine carboxylmethyltransferase family protein [Chloroflexota bacterium]
MLRLNTGLMLVYVVVACWAVFIATWAGGALYNARYAPRTVGDGTKLGFRWWQGWMVAAVGVAALQVLVPRTVWAAITFRNEVAADAGLVILVSSTLFTLWARWTLGKMWSPVPTLREHHELHTNGPYRITRHPIYTGILGMQLGSALIAGYGGVLVALLVSSAVFLVRIPREEKLMLKTFGEQYARYQREVPPLVPFLHL